VKNGGSPSSAATGTDPLSAVQFEPIGPGRKGFPPEAAEIRVGDVAGRGWNVLRGDLPFPVMVLKRTAIVHNVALMARWCRERRVSLAPHAKTTMAPQLVQRQLDAGAWGITVASAAQAAVVRGFGASRILVANEIVDASSLGWLRAELEADPELDIVALVDSSRGVDLMAERLAGAARPLSVLVELGVPGGRTGCRSLGEALDVAEAVRRSPALELVGVEAYEGVIAPDEIGSAIPAVRAFLSNVAGLTAELERRNAFERRNEILVSAGGSVYFDEVVNVLGDRLEPVLGKRLRIVLRSGCYVTHDAGFYDRVSPLGSARGLADPASRFRNAIEVWGVVLSRPEPDRAIVGIGRRDVPFDQGLPIPLTAVGSDHRDVSGTMTVQRLNDQHAFVHVPKDDPLSVGDLLVCGVSHPCSAFDRWSLIPVVDDSYDVVEAVRTFF
jgi:D-serine deaminase-like pyridoxal phosphate-dependent protein